MALDPSNAYQSSTCNAFSASLLLLFCPSCSTVTRFYEQRFPAICKCASTWPCSCAAVKLRKHQFQPVAGVLAKPRSSFEAADSGVVSLDQPTHFRMIRQDTRIRNDFPRERTPQCFFMIFGFPPTYIKDKTAVIKHKRATTRFMLP